MSETEIVVAILGLFGTFFGAFLVYQFGSYQESKQKILSERVALYRPVTHCLLDALYLNEEDSTKKDLKLKELEIKINQLGDELLLFAPPNIYREFLKTMNFKKGASGEQATNFLLMLRKELIGKADLKNNEIYRIKVTQ